MPFETSLRLPKRSVLCCMLLYIVTIAIFCNFTNERQHYWKRGFHKWRFLSCQIVAQTKKWEWKEFKPILTHTNLALKLILFFIIEKKYVWIAPWCWLSLHCTFSKKSQTVTDVIHQNVFLKRSLPLQPSKYSK